MLHLRPKLLDPFRSTRDALFVLGLFHGNHERKEMVAVLWDRVNFEMGPLVWDGGVQRNKIKLKSAVASSGIIQKISMHVKYKHSFSTDRAQHLESRELYGVSDAHFL